MELHNNAWMRRLAAIVAALVVLIPAAVVPRAITNAQSSVGDELFYSQQTGYFFFWDPAILSLQAESSEPGMDWWRLSDGEALVDLWAFAAPGMTTTDCVRNAFDTLAADPASVALEALPVYGGGPYQILGDVAQFVLTADGPDAQGKFAVKLECQEIVPGQSLALESVVMPARVYNERDLEYVGIGGVDFYTFRGLSGSDEELATISDGAGNVVATLTTFLPCNTAEFTVLARGVGGGGDVVIDPSSFIAVDGEGDYLPIALAGWSLPEARPVTSLSLFPGEIGLMRGVVEADPFHSFELYYFAPSGEAIFLAHDLWGCGNAGGAPVVIDIE